MFKFKIFILFILLQSPIHSADLKFNRDIRPILSDACFACHGPAVHKPKGNVRLSHFESVTKKDHRGEAFIVPGSVEKSKIFELIETSDDRKMPPIDSGKSLNPNDIQKLKQWVREGAKYEEHWAFVAPVKPAVQVQSDQLIDHLIEKRLSEKGLSLSDKANKIDLIRRLSYDLRGLPPDFDEVSLYLEDQSDDATDQVIDRFLSSVHYGEKMAQDWLDLARYADTTGFSADRERSNWIYRNWVIDAFNGNMPFDQFTIEQLAGDMLPNASLSQKIATGFHRNSMQALGNNPRKEEYRVKGIIDRIDTTSQVWLGLTIACAQCHDHKYDPITQQEYYELYAIFNNIPHIGKGYGIRGPRMKVYDSHPLYDLNQPLSKKTDKNKNSKKNYTVAQVMREMIKPRNTYVHRGGQFESKGKRVYPKLPNVLGNIPKDVTINRLSFAKQLVSRDNPLVARVVVNRFWQQLFGNGLVKTSEDFGSQGEWPSHPELLDGLALEFMESGWNVKHIIRLMVRSNTYQQSSNVPSNIREIDPDNRLYSYYSRKRLPAEQIRDTMLKVSGAFNPRVGGPSVYPWQSDHLLKRRISLKKWSTSQGVDRYRRAMYTFWMRMTPYSSMQILDAPTREYTCVKRTNSNTPLQALVTLNDPVFFDGAMLFAKRILKNRYNKHEDELLKKAFNIALSRDPNQEERKRFLEEIRDLKETFKNNEKDVLTLTGHKVLTPRAIELATWTSVAMVMLNTDEILCKP